MEIFMSKNLMIIWMCVLCASFIACGEDDSSTATEGGTEAGSAGGSEGGSAGGSTGGSEGGSEGGSTGGATGGSTGGSEGGSEVLSSIVEIASTTEGFSTLVTAAEAAGAVAVLSGEGPFTVFAPTDDAFAKLPEGAVNELVADAEAGGSTLLNILALHVVAGKVMSGDLSDGLSVETLNEMEIIIGITDGLVTVDSGGSVANVTQADIEASNGVIHVIDTVLLPASVDANIVEIAQSNEDFSTLVEAVVAAGAVELLSEEGPFTVFAPTNDAFAQLPEGLVADLVADAEAGGDTLLNILALHVLAGSAMSGDLSDGLSVTTVNEMELIIGITDGIVTVDAGGSVATVIDADIQASNGVIHVIDTVLLPPIDEDKNIVELAQSNEDFSILVEAIVAAGVVELFSGEGTEDDFTVFAPTNDAFAQLPEGLLGDLIADAEAGGDVLLEVLALHAILGSVMSGDLSDGLSVITLNAMELIIGITDGIVTVDSGGSVATVIEADIEASNGVIHVIDTVLLPLMDEDRNIVELAQETEALSTLVDAVIAAGAVELLSEEGPLTVFAPTNEAFAQLPEGTLGNLVADAEAGGSALIDILGLHVIGDLVMSGDLSDGLNALTVNGSTLIVGITDGIVTIDAGGSVATVIEADIDASNGVVHLIDTVLLPAP